MSDKTFFRPVTLLALALGLLFIVTGLSALIDFNSQGAQFTRGLGGFFGGDKALQLVPAVIAVLEIAAGAVLVLTPLGVLQSGLQKILLFVIAILWIGKTIYFDFLTGKVFTPTVLAWLSIFSLDLTILAGLVTVARGSEAKN